jgi:hypothetical protein
MKPSDYTWIKKWGELMSSSQSYIEFEQQRAAEDNAPIKAIYKDIMTGKWRTCDDITNVQTKRLLGLTTQDMNSHIRDT